MYKSYSNPGQRPRPPVAGCVLAGGKSLRMGTDKALLELDGKPLIIHALEQFWGFGEIFVSAADSESYAFTDVRIIVDERPGMGPLGGIISVLKATESVHVCFRPVDAPFVPAGLHRVLSAYCLLKDASVPTYQGRVEPLLACFSKTALMVLEALATAGEFKIAEVFSRLNTTYVPLDAPDITGLFGNPAGYLINVNDMDTFELLKRR